MEKIVFYDDFNDEEVLFEIVDSTVVEGNKYLLVVDEDDEATILKEETGEDDTLIYALVEDEGEFQKVALILMESDEYDLEIN
ncbi:MAG: hypothetical protein ATN35_09900 [Epulopiscium sp. Nele67-Bin004]|nr:MAG: hypothetical protein ATN35_09900 [Epulopiscium sp. Nele67-Bin004]